MLICKGINTYLSNKRRKKRPRRQRVQKEDAAAIIQRTFFFSLFLSHTHNLTLHTRGVDANWAKAHWQHYYKRPLFLWELVFNHQERNSSSLSPVCASASKNYVKSPIQSLITSAYPVFRQREIRGREGRLPLSL